MKLANWAKQQGISYLTAWRWFKHNKLPVKATKTPSGMILVEPKQEKQPNNSTWIYCRVSTHDKKEDLERQIERCTEFCRARGWTIEQITKEIASGMNDNRPKLKKLLNSNPSRIVIEHKDRLTRFGFGYFEQLLPKLGCELIVINRDTEEKSDMVNDLIAIITSFCCRLYGLRSGQNKAQKARSVICDEPAK